jgi:hypothetical protein
MLGRLLLGREITRVQYDAATAYARLRADYNRTTLARPLPSPGDFDRQPGHDDSDGAAPQYQAWCNRVTMDYRRARRALMECPDAMAQVVLDGILDDAPMWHFVGTLRIACNALARLRQSNAA